MSDTYNTIAKARNIANELNGFPQWSKSSIIAEMGVTYKVYANIMEQDPVCAGDKFRRPTIDKLKAFIANHKAVLDKKPSPLGVRTSQPKDPFRLPDPSPPRSPQKPKVSDGSDPLTRLDELVEEFANRGYKLETRIVKIIQ